MGAISINLGALEEYHVRQSKNTSRYINDLVGLAMNGHLKDVSKMTSKQLASILTKFNSTLPPNLVDELQSFLGAVLE